MAMNNKGITKVIEESGELIQILAKKLAYMDVDVHPDGTDSINSRIEEEMADVLASMTFLTDKLNLNQDVIAMRAKQKLNLYEIWDND